MLFSSDYLRYTYASQVWIRIVIVDIQHVSPEVLRAAADDVLFMP